MVIGASKTNKKGPTIKSVDNALTVLQYLSSKNDGSRLSKTSQDLGINIASIHRLLTTLKKKGFVDQDVETKRYYIGPSARSLGSGATTEIDFYNRSLACLNEICEKTFETVNLVMRDNWEAVYALQIQSPRALRVANHVGSRVPLYCTASGKVLLAYLNNEHIQRYFEEVALKPLTHNTLISPDKLE